MNIPGAPEGEASCAHSAWVIITYLGNAERKNKIVSPSDTHDKVTHT